MTHGKVAFALAAAAMALAINSGAAYASPAAPSALSPVNCATNNGAVHVNVPYYPYTYCYAGIGSRTINLTQVHSVESRNWTVTVLWKTPCCGWTQTGLVSGETLYTQDSTVDTISIP